MSNSYFVDLTNFSIEKFETILKSKELLPGRVILKEKLEERFKILKANSINSLSDLLEALKSKTRLISFSKKVNIS